MGSSLNFSLMPFILEKSVNVAVAKIFIIPFCFNVIDAVEVLFEEEILKISISAGPNSTLSK